jgi:hypothetical protein
MYTLSSVELERVMGGAKPNANQPAPAGGQPGGDVWGAIGQKILDLLNHPDQLVAMIRSFFDAGGAGGQDGSADASAQGAAPAAAGAGACSCAPQVAQAPGGKKPRR